ncbi:hypothetical protein COM99_26560 [Bacillus cereus]|nr:hypothetical protein COM99_26560 [Bacillus cereus]PEU50758.1 hypothetical protein CN405_29735 [Bacillus cereus]
MIIRCHKVSKLHNIFKNTYLIGLFVMPIFSTVVEIFLNTPHIYPLSTLKLMDVWRDYMKEGFALLTKNGRLWLDELLTAFYVVPIF